jgi:hypothetical protein
LGLQRLQTKDGMNTMSGVRFTFAVNEKASEVRVSTDNKGKSLIPDYIQIIHDICKEDQPNFPAFLAKRAARATRISGKFSSRIIS